MAIPGAITGRLAYIYASTDTTKTATTAQAKMLQLTDYTLTVDRKVIDVTNHDSSGYDESLSGTMKLTWDAKVVYFSTGAGQQALRSAVLGTNPNAYPISLLQTTKTSAHKYTGVTRLTGFTATHDTNNAVLGTLKGEFSGKVTWVP